MRLDKAVGHFLWHLQANGCSVHTVRSYRSDLRSLHYSYGGNATSVARITAAGLAEFLTSAHALVGPTAVIRSARVLNRLRAVLPLFLRWLHERGCITSDPARALRVRSVHSSPPIVFGR